MDKHGKLIDSRKKVKPEEIESSLDDEDPESTISDQYDNDVTNVSSIGKKRANSPGSVSKDSTILGLEIQKTNAVRL